MSLLPGWSGNRNPVSLSFSAPVQIDPAAHPTPCTMGTIPSSGVSLLGLGVDHPPTYSVEFKDRVDLYLYSHSGLSWSIIGWTLPKIFTMLWILSALHYFTRIIKKLLILKYVFFYSLHHLSETFPIRRPIEHYAINLHRSGRMLNFLDGFLKILMRKFMKTRPVGTELFHADGEKYRYMGKRTDRQMLIINSHLSKFYNDPINNRISRHPV